MANCSNCGMQLPDNVTTCSNCGRLINAPMGTTGFEAQQQLKSEASAPVNVPSQTSSHTTDQNTQVVGQLIMNRVGEFLHKPHYNVRAAAQSYSNIGAVFAGFAFAAMILVMQNTQLPHKLVDAALLRDWATIVFLIALFGSLLSAFTFSVVSGEEILAPRTNMIALFGGIGFSISGSLIFWSLVTLTKVYLDENIVILARLLYPLFALIQPAYLAFTALDNIYLFKDTSPSQREWFQVFLLGYAPLIIAVLLAVPLHLIGFSFTLVPLLWCSTLLAVSIILISNVTALWASDQPHNFDLSPFVTGLAILVHSVVMGLLIFTI